jgi:acyl dehydratase
MMARRHLDHSPRLLDLYLRSALAVVPGASALPMIPGGHRRIPHYEFILDDCRADPRRLARYRAVCGFADHGSMPPTYPHVLAFPLHMRLLADGRFPFSPVGLVHVHNAITQQRPIAADEPLSLYVRGGPLQPHHRGQTFAIQTKVHIGAELVWEEHSTMLRRGAPTADREPVEDESPLPPPAARWDLAGDLGRRYAGVSGDRNPIHLSALTARAFGFRRPVAHGMWTTARCLADLEASLPQSFTTTVRFRRPISLPGSVDFASSPGRFAVRDSDSGQPHLDATVTT